MATFATDSTALCVFVCVCGGIRRQTNPGMDCSRSIACRYFTESRKLLGVQLAASPFATGFDRTIRHCPCRKGSYTHSPGLLYLLIRRSTMSNCSGHTCSMARAFCCAVLSVSMRLMSCQQSSWWLPGAMLINDDGGAAEIQVPADLDVMFIVIAQHGQRRTDKPKNPKVADSCGFDSGHLCSLSIQTFCSDCTNLPALDEFVLIL